MTEPSAVDEIITACMDSGIADIANIWMTGQNWKRSIGHDDDAAAVSAIAAALVVENAASVGTAIAAAPVAGTVIANIPKGARCFTRS
jgi:hypothetical protein